MANIFIIPLVGPVVDSFPEDKLPDCSEVLVQYFRYLKVDKLSKWKAVDDTINLVIDVWKRTPFPIHEKRHVKEKLGKLILAHSLLMKNHTAGGRSQVEKELKFQQSLKSLFDITINKDLVDAELNDDERAFLVDQRGDRILLINSIQRNLQDQIEVGHEVEEGVRDEATGSQDEYEPIGKFLTNLEYLHSHFYLQVCHSIF